MSYRYYIGSNKVVSYCILSSYCLVRVRYLAKWGDDSQLVVLHDISICWIDVGVDYWWLFYTTIVWRQKLILSSYNIALVFDACIKINFCYTQFRGIFGEKKPICDFKFKRTKNVIMVWLLLFDLTLPSLVGWHNSSALMWIGYYDDIISNYMGGKIIGNWA